MEPSTLQIRKVEIDFPDSGAHSTAGQRKYSQLKNALPLEVRRVEPLPNKLLRPVKEQPPDGVQELQGDRSLLFSGLPAFRAARQLLAAPGLLHSDGRQMTDVPRRPKP